ncbi:phosphatase [Kineobactrum sediminis]|uniref:Phosphatase n=1 Tax=Kineobactrum sediminis TaxID=1905677 RepID=A0A2N5Y349_9GAMM|nr:HAD family hydrolase [Kineobactrum sediminis]PLW82779.1 phosphatase [Kineobactrum sediminis]
MQGIIFDLDGTLVNSRLDFDALRAETGCPESLGLLEFMDTLSCPQQRAQTAAIIDRHEQEGAVASTWITGAQRYLEALVAAGVPVGIVTRNSRSVVAKVQQKLLLPDIPVITREDALPKPDPAGLLQLARLWQLPVHRLAYIGDFRFDLEAARNAGMLAVLYAEQSGGDDEHLADLVFSHFDQLAELLPVKRD